MLGIDVTNSPTITSPLLTGDRPKRRCLHGGDRGSLAAKRRELHLERLPVRVHVNRSAHVVDLEALSRW